MWEKEKKEVLEALQRMCEKDLVVGTSGNVSLRIPSAGDGTLAAISPSGRFYDTMTAEDIAIVDFDGKLIEGPYSPSIEMPLHLGIYKTRKKVNAVIHTHSIYGSVLAVAGMEIPCILDDQITHLGGEILVTEYGLSGSPELVRNALAALGPRNAVLLANHGVLSVGRTIREALVNCEMLEKAARIYIGARSLGNVNLVPAEMVEVMKAYYIAVNGD